LNRYSGFNFDDPPSLAVYARWIIGGKNPGELTVRMEMALPQAVVSNGWGGGGEARPELFTFRQDLQIGELLNQIPSIIKLNDW
jgi:hypothetical protein